MEPYRKYVYAVAGVLLAVVAFLIDREQFFRSYLVGFWYWFGASAACRICGPRSVSIRV